MKNTWYLGMFVFALALLGLSIGKSTRANQEIVLKFTERDVTEGKTKEVLRFVKSQLQEVTTGDIQVKQSGKGTLKIIYYSDKDVSEIKELLSYQIELALEDKIPASGTQFPSPENIDLAGYQLDVLEIQAAKDFVGATGTIIEFKAGSIRFFTPNTCSFFEQLIKEKEASTTRAYHSYTTIALAISDSFCKVPQVRAGPVFI